MIIESLRIYLQNIQKNKSLIETLIEIQKTSIPWSIIQTTPSSSNKEGDRVVNIPNYLNWITFFRLNTNDYDHLRVVMYINICLATI